MKDQYLLPVGEAGRQRLEILNRMYNPLAQHFLIKSGLKAGMQVLEVGCGAGDMACWLSQFVGETGKVVAIDSSPKQIEVASQKAKDKGINNIEFHCIDMANVASLGQQFDLIYGRWVIFFYSDIDSIFEKLVNVLKPSGILTYESASHIGEGDFSYPFVEVVGKWFECGHQFFKQNNYTPDLGGRLYHIFKHIGLARQASDQQACCVISY